MKGAYYSGANLILLTAVDRADAAGGKWQRTN
jgi:hypothetical protein